MTMISSFVMNLVKIIFISIILFASCFKNEAQTTEFNKLYKNYLIAYQSGDFSQTLFTAQSLYEQTNSGLSAILLGDLYAGGMGNTPDYENAIKYYRLAANPVSINNEEGKFMTAYANRMLGIISIRSQGETYELTREVMEPFYRAIEIGNDAYSMYFIGHCTLNGEFTEGDEEMAFKYLEMAGENNCIPALVDLGGIYEDNVGDIETALNYYIKAASIDIYTPNSDNFMQLFVDPNLKMDETVIQCWNSACNNAGIIYMGIENYEEAIRWLQKITLKQPKYFRNRAICYDELGEQDKAISELEESLCIEEDSRVHHLLGMMYYEYKEDKIKSKMHLIRAIEMGNKEAEKSYNEYFN